MAKPEQYVMIYIGKSMEKAKGNRKAHCLFTGQVTGPMLRRPNHAEDVFLCGRKSKHWYCWWPVTYQLETTHLDEYCCKTCLNKLHKAIDVLGNAVGSLLNNG